MKCTRWKHNTFIDGCRVCTLSSWMLHRKIVRWCLRSVRQLHIYVCKAVVVVVQERERETLLCVAEMVCVCKWDYFFLHYQQWVHSDGCGICSWCRGAGVCVFVCMWVFPLRSLCQFKSVWHTATHWSLDLQQAQRKTHAIVYRLWFSSVHSSHLCLGTVRIYFKRLLRSLRAAHNHLKL